MIDKKEVFFSTHCKKMPVFFSNFLIREIPVICEKDKALIHQKKPLEIPQYHTRQCEVIFPVKLISKLFLPNE